MYVMLCITDCLIYIYTYILGSCHYIMYIVVASAAAIVISTVQIFHSFLLHIRAPRANYDLPAHPTDRPTQLKKESARYDSY